MSVPPTERGVLADPAYPRLKDHLIRVTGLSYYGNKDRQLAQHVARRMQERGCPDCAAYLALLRSDREGALELDEVLKALTIGETYFFRHPELFDALRDVVIPDLLERNRAARRLRIWSAGCSLGAEPYSLAILLRQHFGPRLEGWNVSILGTDVNRDFLAQARKGVFGEWQLRSTPEWLRLACFEHQEPRWAIRPQYREWVSFQYHNLVTHDFPSLLDNLFAFDLILCRNVVIYFETRIVARIAEQFHRSLLDGGWLLVGHSEPNVELFGAFRALNLSGAVLYQKDEAGEARLPWLAPPPEPAAAAPAWSAEPEPAAPNWPVPASWDWSDADAPSAKPAEEPPPAPPELLWEWPGLDALAPEPIAKEVAPRPHRPVEAAPLATPDALAPLRELMDRARWSEVEKRCQERLQRDRTDPHAHYYLGLALEQMGRSQEAEQSLRRVLYLDRRFVLARYHLGLLQLRQGALEGARSCFRNTLHALSRLRPEHAFPEVEGLTAGRLAEMSARQLEVLEDA